jgi:hypothetical protein
LPAKQTGGFYFRMNMKESQQTLSADDTTTRFDEEATLVSTGEEATLVAPRFDDEETVHARPVVPFEATTSNAGAATMLAPTSATAAPTSLSAAPRSAYSRLPFAPRRSLLLALVLVSVLAGGVLGGTALYFYQNHARADETSASAPSQPNNDEAASQPSPAPTAETVSQSPPSEAQPESPASNAPSDEATNDKAKAKANEETGASDSDDREADAHGSARDAENVPAAARRKEATDEGERVGAPKHGKKGDDASEQPRRHANQADDERRLSRADDGRLSHADDESAAPGPREARRVDTIIYRPRRARTRRETASDADRLRRIFEGRP